MTPNAGTSQKTSTASSQKKNLQISPFPNGFQTLVEEVCDQTSVVELELKVGDFEMILKRDIGIPKSSDSAVIGSPVLAPPIPSRPVEEIVSAHTPVVEQKSSTAGSSPFNNISPKLASLEASGQNGYILVSSPTVGSSQIGRTLKGKRQPPSCREGDIIKEGQIVGFLDQLGNLLPVRTDVSGEVFKILYNDGEAVGYRDPLIAVLPYSTA
ncbi:hypothetical protein Cni_G27367 [Canna indica]|uniref:Lipoyl-binding domain-containing protein n=1 Tax=Canna indica TaxID=4628 RepID=A0AAQ3QS54_9LILI|nr:hypothetical protein Cni_G27367 [Canna indica]